MGTLRNRTQSLFGGWGGPSRIDDGPAYPRRPRRTGRTERLALESRLATAGFPPRRGRRRERQYLRRVEKARRREAERRPRRGGPRLRPRPSSRTWQARVFKDPRVIVVALCSLASCRKPHTQRRPQFQASRRPGAGGAHDLLPGWPAYCCTPHRMRDAYERRRDRTLARRVPQTVCAGCGRRIAVQRLRSEGGRYVPRRGRPRRCCDRNCRQRAYRAAHPSPPRGLAFYDDPCRSCGARIVASGRPGRPPTRCAGCRVPAPQTPVIPVQAGIQEIEAQRRRDRTDPEYREWLRSRGELQ